MFHDYNRARAALLADGVEITKRKPVSKFMRRLITGASLTAMFLAAGGLASIEPAYAHGPTYLGAAGAWTFFNEAKKYLMQGDIDLNSNTFRISLHTSASNAATATLSTKGSITSEVTEANGYSSSGKALTGVTWTVGASATEYRFNAAALVWTATGGDINNIKFAVIWIEGASAGARKLLCKSTLSTSQFNVTTGNTLTLTPSANGIFELN